MTYQALDSSWHSTDEDPVPIHVQEKESTSHPSHSNQSFLPQSSERYSVRVVPHNNPSVTLSAIVGVGIFLLLGAVFYIGLDNLRGELGSATTVAITIRPDGTFDPPTVDVMPGNELVITSEHESPQVLKSTQASLGVSPALFTTPLVLFRSEPYKTDVAAETAGNTYTFTSSTLPDSSTLTIHVNGGASATQQAQTLQSSDSSSLDPIPIPDSMDERIVSSPVGVSVNASASREVSAPETVASQATEDGDSVTFEIKSETSSQKLEQPAMNRSTLPTNPYTVGNAANRVTQSVRNVLQTKKPSPTHAAAPAYPPSQPETGPEMWVSVIAALVLFSLLAFAIEKRRKRI